MAKRVRVELDHAGMSALLRDAGVRAELSSRMQAALSYARSNAPLDSGAYRDSLALHQDTTDRAVVRLGAGVDYAMAVEAGTGLLARSLDAAGGDGSGANIKQKYTTKSGKTIWATQAQVDNWTRGR